MQHRPFNPITDAVHLEHLRAFRAAQYRALCSGVRQTVRRTTTHPLLGPVWLVQSV